MNFKIRRMLRDDVDSVFRLECIIFKDAWSYKHLLSETDGNDYNCMYQLPSNPNESDIRVYGL